MRILARVVATLGLVALVLAVLVWWTGRADHSDGDAEVMATGLEVPWGLAFLPTGDALVGERTTGRIYEIPAAGGERTLVATVPGVVPGGEGGLLGIALDPLFMHSGHSFVYAYLTAESDNRIVRFQLDPTEPEVTNFQVLVDGIAKAANHDGGALAFGPDGMLYAGVGDAGVPSRAQDPASLNGKILRMDPLGHPPVIDTNPDPDSLVWSMGHRNVQGLAWDSDGRLWATEFGQDTYDEVNLIEPGKNYGWPEVEGVGHDPRYVDPQVTWSTDEASPSGAAIMGDHPLRRRPARGAAVEHDSDQARRRAARRPARGRSTAGCATSSPRRTARCGSPPATATAAATRTATTTGCCGSSSARRRETAARSAEYDVTSALCLGPWLTTFPLVGSRTTWPPAPGRHSAQIPPEPPMRR